LDSHNHAHEEWALTSLIIELAITMEIPYVRLCKNFGAGMSAPKQLYRHFVNARFRRARRAATRYFGLPEDYQLFCRRTAGTGRGNASWEIMIHPVLNKDQQLMDNWLRQPLSRVITNLPAYEDAVSYSQHRYQRRRTGNVAAMDIGNSGTDCRWPDVDD
jgi:hypothetical protein